MRVIRVLLTRTPMWRLFWPIANSKKEEHMNKSKEKEQSFESSLASLERIVAHLESGDLPLERALELFEEGVALARRCQSQLGDAERKVEMLLRERGELKVVPFDGSKDAPAGNSETAQAYQRPMSPRSARRRNQEKRQRTKAAPMIQSPSKSFKFEPVVDITEYFQQKAARVDQWLDRLLP